MKQLDTLIDKAVASSIASLEAMLGAVEHALTVQQRGHAERAIRGGRLQLKVDLHADGHRSIRLSARVGSEIKTLAVHERDVTL